MHAENACGSYGMLGASPWRVFVQASQREEAVEALDRRLEMAEASVDAVRSDIEDVRTAAEFTRDRVSDLEEDTRAQDALEAARGAAQASQAITGLQEDLEEGLTDMTTQLEELRAQVCPHMHETHACVSPC